MTLEDLENEDNISEAMETEVAYNRTPTKLKSSIDHSSSSKLVTPLSKPTTFVWEHYLNNEFFGQWLLKYIIPHTYKEQVKEIFKVLDNIQDFEQLEYNFEYLEPEVLLDWFPSSDRCLTNLDGLICLILLPTVIKDTKTSSTTKDFQSQVTYA